MVMEFMEGGTLKEAGTSYNFQEPHIAYIAKEVCFLFLFLLFCFLNFTFLDT